MAAPDFESTQQLFRAAGFTVGETRNDDEVFGCWSIELTRSGLPAQHVFWDGRERCLIVSAFASSGSWMAKWEGKKPSEQTAEFALEKLETPVTREWEQEIERKREAYRNAFMLEQTLRLARPLWDTGRFAAYVRELAPYRGQLSPAQLKRLEIAEKRAGN